MTAFAEATLIAWSRNADYGKKIVADLTVDQMIIQPGPGMNHPAWILSHLNAYHGPLLAMLSGEEFADPKDHPFGMQSKPESDAAIYASKDELVAAWQQGHDDVALHLAAATDETLAQPLKLERWAKPFPRVIDALPYIMISHESTHLGQLSAWRRVQGLPSV